jgi:hypothetical protein
MFIMNTDIVGYFLETSALLLTLAFLCYMLAKFDTYVLNNVPYHLYSIGKRLAIFGLILLVIMILLIMIFGFKEIN